jgi:signal transduction histidine kinase
MSFVAYFIFQADYERQIRETIFAQAKIRQETYAKSIADNIASDLNNLMGRLKLLSQSKLIQDGETAGPKADAFLKEVSDDASQVASIDGVTVLDEKNIIRNYNSPTLERGRYVGVDGSNTPAIIQFTDNMRKPTFTNRYTSPFDQSNRIALIHPITDLASGEYRGLVSTGVVLETFVKQYGNTDDANALYLALVDANHTVMSSPFKDTIGVNYFDPQFQQSITPESDAHFKAVLSGQSRVDIFDFRLGESIVAGMPIVINGNPEYYLFVVNPTASVYAQIDSVLFNQRIGFSLLQSGIVGAIAILLFFLLRWSGALETAVQKRTNELNQSNERLAAKTEELREANMRLKLHDEMQTEFINIAAHELRSPIQPILTMAEVLGSSSNVEVRARKEELRIIERNAARLERLSADILDVGRIESGSLRLHMERFDLGALVNEAIDDAKRYDETDSVEITYLAPREQLIVVADRYRIMQVLTNLLNNAIRSTKPSGIVTISATSQENEAKVTIHDTGTGIQQDMIPKLFTKFSSGTVDGKGTGVGLFISKGIIEAHGGKIWGENNRDSKGATFAFTLPVNRKSS